MFGFWRKKSPVAPVDDERAAQLDWELGMINRGFAHWMYESPPHGVTVELYRREWPTGHIMERDKVAPEANAWGLWWRIPGQLCIDGEPVDPLDLHALPPPAPRNARTGRQT